MAEEEREGCNNNKKPLLTEQVVKQVITTGNHEDETNTKSKTKENALGIKHREQQILKMSYNF